MKQAEAAGYPVLLKATGGGGGIGIYQCPDEAAVRSNFAAAGRCAGRRAVHRVRVRVGQGWAPAHAGHGCGCPS